MPACVRVEAWAVVGVLVPEDSGVTAMGAIVWLCMMDPGIQWVRLVWPSIESMSSGDQ
jgi:hypothetical protein